MSQEHIGATVGQDPVWEARYHRNGMIVMFAVLLVAPFLIYPVFLMKALCFALFACAFNLLIGYGGLLSFGHAMFLGMAGYLSAHAAKVWGVTPELAIGYPRLWSRLTAHCEIAILIGWVIAATTESGGGNASAR